MIETALQFYDQLLQDIKHCNEKELSEVEKVECCFQICNKYWTIVRESVRKHEFEDPKEEIEFFKKVKPLFTCLIEFYNLVYHALLFIPEHDFLEEKRFWQRESKRLEKFIEENKEFYEYYKTGKTDKDAFFFLRKNNLNNFLTGKTYELDGKAMTSHDYLVTDLLALEKDKDHVSQQLKRFEN